MKIAITGGIAEGKTTVLKLIEAQGFSCESADAIARDIFWNEEVQAELGGLMGIVGEISPVALKAAIGTDEELRRNVNQVIHPAVADAIQQSTATFFEVPLLLETCLQVEFDEVWVVSCNLAEKQRRLAERYGENAIPPLAQVQMSGGTRLAFADVHISTDFAVATVADQISAELKSSGV